MDTTEQARQAPRGADRSFADCVPMMVWTARPDMSCDYVSRAWVEYTGHSSEQALGDGWSRSIHPEDLAGWLDTSVRAFDAREPYEIEYRLRRRDGAYRWVLDRARPRFAADGVFLGYIGSCLEIDDRKRGERELARSLERERRLRTAVEEASRLKEAFVLSVLEDLQSPVLAIQTWAAHLRGQVPAESEAARALESIVRNAGAQGRIIDSLLELSRAAGRGGCSAPQTARRAKKERLLTGVRVLVVDDDPGTRETIVKVLRIAGAETRTAESTHEAIEALGAWHPDVMLSDCARAGGEGHVLIRAVRSLPAERGGCLRAAALTERAQGTEARAVHAGYDAEVAKPVEPVALLATVARLAHPAV